MLFLSTNSNNAESDSDEIDPEEEARLYVKFYEDIAKEHDAQQHGNLCSLNYVNESAIKTNLKSEDDIEAVDDDVEGDEVAECSAAPPTFICPNSYNKKSKQTLEITNFEIPMQKLSKIKNHIDSLCSDDDDVDNDGGGDCNGAIMIASSPLTTSAKIASQPHSSSSSSSTTTKQKQVDGQKSSAISLESLIVRCNLCSLIGHNARDCSLSSSANGMLGTAAVCALCAGRGHTSEECDNVCCLICWKSGHEWQRCPATLKYKRKSCSRCGRSGHFINQCADFWRQFRYTTVSSVAPQPPCGLASNSTKEDVARWYSAHTDYLEADSCAKCGSQTHNVQNCRNHLKRHSKTFVTRMNFPAPPHHPIKFDRAARKRSQESSPPPSLFRRRRLSSASSASVVGGAANDSVSVCANACVASNSASSSSSDNESSSSSTLRNQKHATINNDEDDDDGAEIQPIRSAAASNFFSELCDKQSDVQIDNSGFIMLSRDGQSGQLGASTRTQTQTDTPTTSSLAAPGKMSAKQVCKLIRQAEDPIAELQRCLPVLQHFSDREVMAFVRQIKPADLQRLFPEEWRAELDKWTKNWRQNEANLCEQLQLKLKQFVSSGYIPADTNKLQSRMDQWLRSVEPQHHTPAQQEYFCDQRKERALIGGECFFAAANQHRTDHRNDYDYDYRQSNATSSSSSQKHRNRLLDSVGATIHSIRNRVVDRETTTTTKFPKMYTPTEQKEQHQQEKEGEEERQQATKFIRDKRPNLNNNNYEGGGASMNKFNFAAVAANFRKLVNKKCRFTNSSSSSDRRTFKNGFIKKNKY